MSRSPQELGDGQARDLLRRAKALDEGALDWIYRAYADRAYRYVLSRTGDRELADDVVSRAFVKLLDGLETYAIPERDIQAQFTGWLYRVVHNAMIDWLRKEKRESEARAEALRQPGPSLSAGLERRLLAEDVRRALVELTEEQRRVLVLRFYEELSLAEAAALLGKSVEAVKKLQQRGLASLARVMAGPPGPGQERV